MPPDREMNWRELPAEDVLARLSQDAAAGRRAVSAFLDTHQWSPLTGVAGAVFAGGHPRAQFRRVALGGGPPEVACAALELSGALAGVRSVRQLRLKLERLGLPPDHVGDIVLGPSAYLACMPGTDWDGAGLAARTLPEWTAPQPAPGRATVAAARVDALAAAVFHVSRGEAQTAVRYGFVFLNFAGITKPAAPFKAGDSLVYRTKGRAEVIAVEAGQRSGRLRVDFAVFPC